MVENKKGIKNDVLGSKVPERERERESTAGEGVPTARHRIEQLWRSQIIKFSVGFRHTHTHTHTW